MLVEAAASEKEDGKGGRVPSSTESAHEVPAGREAGTGVGAFCRAEAKSDSTLAQRSCQACSSAPASSLAFAACQGCGRP